MSTILPTVASLILAQAIGFVWYHPSLGWGSRWMAAMKQSNPNFVPSPDPKIYAVTAGTWLVSALLYSHLVLTMFGGSQAAWMDLCGLSLVLGGGFVAPPYVMAILFEQKNKIVSLLGFGYIQTVLLAMATCHAFL
jgi:Protein of unknown function (DUF1761)